MLANKRLQFLRISSTAAVPIVDLFGVGLPGNLILNTFWTLTYDIVWYNVSQEKRIFGL